MTTEPEIPPKEWERRHSSAVPYPGWEFLFSLDGVMHHRPTAGTLTVMERKAQAAERLAEALEEIIGRNEIQHWFNLDQARAALRAYSEIKDKGK